MIDLKTISKMNVDEWTEYVSKLSTEDIVTNINLLNMAHGFILCRELIKFNLSQEVITEIFYASMLNNTMISLENTYKKN